MYSNKINYLISLQTQKQNLYIILYIHKHELYKLNSFLEFEKNCYFKTWNILSYANVLEHKPAIIWQMYKQNEKSK